MTKATRYWLQKFADRMGETEIKQETEIRKREIMEENLQSLTPYTETKTAYIGDKEVTFMTDKTGNLSVFFPNKYTVERLADRIIISFDELEEVTDITISIL